MFVKLPTIQYPSVTKNIFANPIKYHRNRVVLTKVTNTYHQLQSFLLSQRHLGSDIDVLLPFKCKDMLKM